MKETLSKQPVSVNDPDALWSFAAPVGTQLETVLMSLPAILAYSLISTLQSRSLSSQCMCKPVQKHHETCLILAQAMFIGFSFCKTPNSLQGLQNQLFPVFTLLTIFSNFCQQIMPYFVTQRDLYEVRERLSKTSSWKMFILSNILVEIPWNRLMAVLVFIGWYYPIGLRQNAVEAGQVAERGALMFLFILTFMIFAGTFTNMVIAGIETAETAGNITNLIFSLSLIFCGYVMSSPLPPLLPATSTFPPKIQAPFRRAYTDITPPSVLTTPTALPSFWIFLYRVSPFTYLVSGMLPVGLANAPISCSTEKLLHFSPPSLTNCSTYLSPYIKEFGGYLIPDSMNWTTECVFCSGSETNIFLEGVSAEYGDRWRKFGNFLIYATFNVAAAVGLYWLARVPKGKREKE